MSYSNLRFDYSKLKRPAKINGRYTIPAATNANVNKQGYSTLNEISQTTSATIGNRKRIFDEEEYVSFLKFTINNIIMFFPYFKHIFNAFFKYNISIIFLPVYSKKVILSIMIFLKNPY